MYHTLCFLSFLLVELHLFSLLDVYQAKYKPMNGTKLPTLDIITDMSFAVTENLTVGKTDYTIE